MGSFRPRSPASHHWFLHTSMKCSPVQIARRAERGALRRAAPALILALAGSIVSRGARAQGAPSLTLQSVLDSVSIRYPVVLAAQARVRAAEGSRTTAGAFGNPILGYQIDDNVDNTILPGGGTKRSLVPERIATVTLPLEPLYQRGARVRRADAEVRAAKEDAVAVRQQAALRAAQAFYRTALAQVGVATARDLLVWLDSLVTYNRSRVKEGAAAEADLIRSQLERDRAAAEATVQEAELAQARASLSTFAGVSFPGTQSLVLGGDIRPLSLPHDSLSSSGPMPVPRAMGDLAPQRQALLDRAEVRAARERVVATSASISSERTLILRQLGATVGTKQTAGTTSIIAGLTLPIPLFDQNRGEIQRARAEHEAAAYDLAAQEQSVSAEVTGAREAARLLTERALSMTSGGQDFLGKADEARRIALGAYREGAVPLFQVIDASRAWNDARLTYFRTLYAQHESVLALVAAEGGDLFTSLPALTPPVTPNR